jgi:hypothetical protein
MLPVAVHLKLPESVLVPVKLYVYVPVLAYVGVYWNAPFPVNRDAHELFQKLSV